MAKKTKNAGKQPTDNANFLQVSKFLKIVSDENRLKILLALGDGPMNVTEIHNKLKLPQNLASHHISKLKSLDLLVEKKDGTFRFYSANSSKIKEYNQLLRKTLGV